MSETKHLTRTIIISTLTLAVWTAAPAQDLPFSLTEVGPNVWAAIGGANPATGSNAGFVIGDDGVVVIDTFASAAGAKQTIPDAGVVFTGDLFWHRGLPNLIDATTASWIETLDALSAAAHRDPAERTPPRADLPARHATGWRFPHDVPRRFQSRAHGRALSLL